MGGLNMPQPYDYSTQPVNVDNYFNSLRQGREDRSQQEAATRQSALQKYMPGALNGDKAATEQAYANATPEQAMQLKKSLMDLEDRQLQKAREEQDQFARLAQWADTPDKWAQATQMAEANGMKGAAQVPFDQREAKLAGMMSVKDQLDQEWKRRQFELQTRETNASIAAKNAAADASRRAGATPKGVDPNTGVRTPPAGVEGRDYSELAKYGAEADAAAKIASTLQGVMPAIQKGWSGPDFGTRRTVAGALWAIPGGGPGNEIINTYDQIDQAAKISGIEALKGIGGSDTERELLTAIQTGVNPELTQAENERRARGQIAASDILSKKAQLASEWVNRFGSLKYGAPDGTTWQKFWPNYQKQEWTAHRKREAEIAAETARRKSGGSQASSVIDAADAIISNPRGRSDGR